MVVLSSKNNSVCISGHIKIFYNFNEFPLNLEAAGKCFYRYNSGLLTRNLGCSGRDDDYSCFIYRTHKDYGIITLDFILNIPFLSSRKTACPMAQYILKK